MNDQELEREIETVREILHVRLRRYNREMRELEKDLRELRLLQRARRAARAPVGERAPSEPVPEESSP